jgi:hypothetical protein
VLGCIRARVQVRFRTKARAFSSDKIKVCIGVRAKVKVLYS